MKKTNLEETIKNPNVTTYSTNNELGTSEGNNEGNNEEGNEEENNEGNDEESVTDKGGNGNTAANSGGTPTKDGRPKPDVGVGTFGLR